MGAGANGAFNTGVTLGVAGIPGDPSDKAASFVAASLADVTVPYAAALNPATTFSIEVWAKASASGSGYRTPINSRIATGGDAYGYNLYIAPNNTWEFWTGGGGASWNVLGGGPTASTTSFDHLVGTYDGAAMGLYVNGVQVGSPVTVPYAANPSARLTIGASETDEYYFQGTLDEVAVYSTVLSQARISAHDLAGFTPPSVPEPGAALLAGVALLLVLARARAV